jgi:hypothetical protein
MNRENIRTPVRSAANIEFHANYDHANEVARRIVRTLEQSGVRGMVPGASFPMEMDQFPGKVWVISHKPIAVAAGLGHMGIGRPNLSVTADSKTWLGFLAKEKNLILALLQRQIRIQGSPKLLLLFGRCFPA